jgi:hypothetical protein
MQNRCRGAGPRGKRDGLEEDAGGRHRGLLRERRWVDVGEGDRGAGWEAEEGAKGASSQSGQRQSSTWALGFERLHSRAQGLQLWGPMVRCGRAIGGALPRTSCLPQHMRKGRGGGGALAAAGFHPTVQKRNNVIYNAYKSEVLGSVLMSSIVMHIARGPRVMRRRQQDAPHRRYIAQGKMQRSLTDIGIWDIYIAIASVHVKLG